MEDADLTDKGRLFHILGLAIENAPSPHNFNLSWIWQRTVWRSQASYWLIHV